MLLAKSSSAILSLLAKPRCLRIFHPILARRGFSASLVRYSFEMETVDTSKRLSKLRELMKEHKVDLYGNAGHAAVYGILLTIPLVVPSEDSHKSEFIAPCDARRGKVNEDT